MAGRLEAVEVYSRAEVTEVGRDGGVVTRTLPNQLRRVIPPPPGPILSVEDSKAVEENADYVTVNYAGADRTAEKPLGRSGWIVHVQTGEHRGEAWEIDVEPHEVTRGEEVEPEYYRRREVLIEEVQRRAGRRGGVFIF